MASFVQRMIGASKLDTQTYEEVEADPKSMGQAMAVVVLSAIAGGIGTIGSEGGPHFIPMTIGALLGWYVWAFMTWLVGTKLLAVPGTSADIGQLLRTIGFAAAPGILRVFAALPLIGNLIAVACGIWMLASMTVAVRQALDYPTTGRAIAVCVVGFLFYVGTLAAIALLFGVGVATLTGSSGAGN